MDKILVVEDEKRVREPLTEILSICNYDVIEAENGLEALEQAKRHNVSLVLCDMMMPLMNGIETLEAFQRDFNLRTIPFVFISALSERQDVRRGMLKGAEDYLTKPFKTKELLKVVELQLKKARNRQMAPKPKSAQALKEEKKSELKIIESYLKSAGHVQNAILPSKREVDNIFPNNFIFFKPKYEVSGDFYWIKDFGDKKIVSVIDCTGHGISASLLSMCYYTALNQAVKHNDNKSPKEIFEWIIDNVQDYLSQHDSENHDSGMDGIICEIDVVNKKLKYVGAKRPLFFLSNTSLNCAANESICTKKSGERNLNRIRGGNRYFKLEDPKTKTNLIEREIDFEEGDIIYLSSDGFEDQFGGDEDKRFKSGNFMNLLSSIQKEDMQNQKTILESSFENWKHGYQQIDDVTVVGIKL